MILSSSAVERSAVNSPRRIVGLRGVSDRFFTYVIISEPTGETYVGQTEDVRRRIVEHNDPDNHRTLHTKRRLGPWIVGYWETHNSRAEAMKRERFLKTGKGLEWIRENIAEWLANPAALP